MENIDIRALTPDDVPAYLRLRLALWPHMSNRENECDAQEILSQPDRFTAFVAESGGVIMGFIDVSLRQYADGCDTSPVGYIEGWYVAPESRLLGIGWKLVMAAENWSRSKGCSEMASDAIIENVDSQRAHARLGYTEVERQVCFRKDLK